MGRKKLDLIGQKYGRLEVIDFREMDNHGDSKWLCQCDCGTEKVIRGFQLTNGNTKSCGCLRRETVIRNNTTHGHTISGIASKTFMAWSNMIQRCTNPKNKKFPLYGGRGITVCDRWLGDNGFQNFLADMGEAPPMMSIERKDNRETYTPENCVWASPMLQNNNKRNNIQIFIPGGSVSLAEAARRFGYDYKELYYYYRVKNRPLSWIIKHEVAA
jgi:hypothetical protein